MADVQAIAPRSDAKTSQGKSGASALQRRPHMKVTLYERISSFLMALMMAVGVMLFAAVSFWLAHRPPPEAELVPLEIVNLDPEIDFGGSLDGVVGGTAEVDSGSDGGGGGGETSDSDVPPLEASLAAVTSTAGTAASQVDLAYLDSQTSSSTTGTGAGTGSGDGTGGGRRPLGFGDGKGGGVPRELRWFVSFAGDNALDEYARQLDAFGIELGVLLPAGKIVYLSGLSKSPVKRESTSGKDEKRLFFTWQGGERKEADVQLFGRNGVTVGSGKIMHFYPQKLEDILATVEFNYAKRKAKEIRRTYFQVQKAAGGYQFIVTRQTYLQ
jgi:hypothetical protein